MNVGLALGACLTVAWPLPAGEAVLSLTCPPATPGPTLSKPPAATVPRRPKKKEA